MMPSTAAYNQAPSFSAISPIDQLQMKQKAIVNDATIDFRPLEQTGRQFLTSTTSPASPTVTHAQAEARATATQMATHFVTQDKSMSVIRLDPEDLGHVRMTLKTSENGITMMIVTEKPETSEMMRRHINELADEFRSMGFASLNFEFGGQQASDGKVLEHSDIPDQDEPEQLIPTPQTTPQHVSGKLDMRL